MALNIAGTGLSYSDLCELYTKFGKKRVPTNLKHASLTV